MASNTYKSNTFRKKEKAKKKKSSFNFSLGALKDKKIGLSFGILFMMIGLFLFFAFLGYLFTGPADQSVVSGGNAEVTLRQNAAEARNWLGYAGAYVSHWLIFRWFGLAAFLLPPFLFLLGFKWAFKKSLVPMTQYSAFALFFVFWLGLLLGYVVHILKGFSYLQFLSGGFGYEMAVLADEFLGWGTFILIFGSLLIFVVFFFNITHIDWLQHDLKSDDPYIAPKPAAPVSRESNISEPSQEDEMEEDEEEVMMSDQEEEDEQSWTIKSAQPEKKKTDRKSVV